mgnify:CR=1 FL=1
MAILSLGNKTVLTQTGSAEPILKNTVQVESGITLPSPTVSNPTFKTGTFTPFWSLFGTTTPAFIYTGTTHVQYGIYTKIGNVVFFQILLRNDNSAKSYNTAGGVSSDGSNSVSVGGLPYVPIDSGKSGTNQGTVLEISYGTTNAWTGYTKFGLFNKANSSIYIYYHNSSTINNVSIASYSGGDSVSNLTGHYFTSQND